MKEMKSIMDMNLDNNSSIPKYLIREDLLELKLYIEQQKRNEFELNCLVFQSLNIKLAIENAELKVKEYKGRLQKLQELIQEKKVESEEAKKKYTELSNEFAVKYNMDSNETIDFDTGKITKREKINDSKPINQNKHL